MTWVPLHVHSQYSVLDSSAPIKGIAEKAADFGLPAVALTDHGSLYGAVEFFKACKGKGVKPILGLDAYLAPACHTEKQRIPGRRAAYSIVLLAKTDEGYHNLCKLSSIGHLEGFYYYPRISKKLLEEHSEGLICLSSGTNGWHADAALNSREALVTETRYFQELFGKDFYFELQRHHMSEDELQSDGMHQESWLLHQYQSYIEKQQQVNQLFLDVGQELGVRSVAANDSHYLERSDWKAHEILLNVASGEPCEIWEKDSLGNNKFKVPNPKRHTYASHQLYFVSPEEMAQRFADLPDALQASVDIAEECNAALDFDTQHYPVYYPPSIEGQDLDAQRRQEAVTDYILQLCEEGIPKRYTAERLEKVKEKYPDQEPMQVVRERLKHEMEVITSRSLADYLLIVWDFIHWSKSHGIPIGPGRGSGAGSIILYLIGITDIEPLRFNLFFERFINPERPSYPDIDVDICMDKRGQVIDYTVNKYGKENVAQIITFGTMKAKMAIKDVGRVLNVPLAKVNAIAKLVPEDPNMTLEKALEIDPDLTDMAATDDEARDILKYAKLLEGSIRNTGIHAAGVIIAGTPLTDHIPVCRAKDSELAATQFSMKPVESVGMLKVDFLGLKTLTSIQICVDMIKANHGIELDWMNLNLESPPAFELLNHGKTLGVFQMESGGMQELAKQLHLDKFEEIIAVLSLYRPGPMDMIPSFIARKHGREPIEYDHPWMKDILSETYGIMVYQEQVMQIAQNLANYSLGEGDVLRRAMGKKDAAQMAKEREKFRTGCLDNDIPEDTSMAIFDKMEKFAAYGFNKSHAAAYGYLTYVTAYLKADYPKEWMAALMTCDRDDITKVAKFIRECEAMDIAILPPDVNEAGSTFTAVAQGVRFAISGIKGVGSGVVDAIVEERDKEGPFTSLYNFVQRIDTKRINKRAIEEMVDAGCFDFTEWSRDALKQSVEPMYDAAAREQKEAASGMMSLFSLMDENDEGRFAKPPKVEKPRHKVQLYLREKELLGFFLTGHPMDNYKDILQRLSCVPLQMVRDLSQETAVRAAFLIESVQTRISQKGQRKFAIVQISDGMEHLEMMVWPDLYEQQQHLLAENQLLYAVLHVDRRDGSLRVAASWLGDLTRADEAMIADCDNAFDKEKLKIQRFAHSKAKGGGKGKGKDQKVSQKEEKPKAPSMLNVTLDTSKLRLSHILQLRQQLRAAAGPTPVQIQFAAQGRKLATLHVDPQQGVKLSAGLKSSLSKLEAVVTVE